MDKIIEKTIKALEKNNMNAFYADTCEQAVEIAKGLIENGDVISHGGSVTLKESGFTELFKSGNYNYLDRSAPGLSDEDIMALYRECFSADAYFSSANAITHNGEIYNVDGTCNRVAPLLFGPKKVIIVVGVNKIVENIDAAAKRVKEIAAPLNCTRLNKNTYCNTNGKCVTLQDEDGEFCSGCSSQDRICCGYTVMAFQRFKGRVNVIIVNEKLGY